MITTYSYLFPFKEDIFVQEKFPLFFFKKSLFLNAYMDGERRSKRGIRNTTAKKDTVARKKGTESCCRRLNRIKLND